MKFTQLILESNSPILYHRSTHKFKDGEILEAYEKNKSRTKMKQIKQYDNSDYMFNETKILQIPIEPSDFKYQESKTYCKHCGEII